MKPVAKSVGYHKVVELGHQFQTETRDIDVKGLDSSSTHLFSAMAAFVLQTVLLTLFRSW